MHTRLYSFLTKFKLLYMYQFGFRKNHSTSLALMSMIDKVSELLDKKEYVTGLYLDLTKAFDTVQHDILLKKLEHYGIRGIVNKWFSSYLSNRKQYVYVNGVESDVKHVNIGVPQGSVLGPLLFIIYLNDIANSVTSLKCLTMLFADDSNVFLWDNDPVKLMKETEKSIVEITNWFHVNKLTVSLEKTKYNIFHAKNRSIRGFDKINVMNTEIDRVVSAKYLGVFIDETLSFTNHINELINTLRKYASSFKIIRNYVPDLCKKTVILCTCSRTNPVWH